MWLRYEGNQKGMTHDDAISAGSGRLMRVMRQMRLRRSMQPRSGTGRHSEDASAPELSREAGRQWRELQRRIECASVMAHSGCCMTVHDAGNAWGCQG